ncbi:MAG: tetratricopeptide repeat protein [Gemmataceae bacterium]
MTPRPEQSEGDGGVAAPLEDSGRGVTGSPLVACVVEDGHVHPMRTTICTLAISLVLTPATPAQQTGDAKSLREQAERVIAAKPDDPAGYVLRGQSYVRERNAEKALADFTKALDLKPDVPTVLSLRGGELFKLGRFAESIADFDKQIALDPKSAEDHWRRGIALYYAGRYADGAKQFELGKRVYGNDVENAFWHYLCLARVDGPAKARTKLLPIGSDARYYMPKVFDLIAGKAKPEDVLAAVEASPVRDKTEGRFYAHLYVGLNYEAEGDAAKSLDHMKTAVERYVIGHYMWDVAKAHVAARTAKK